MIIKRIPQIKGRSALFAITESTIRPLTVSSNWKRESDTQYNIAGTASCCTSGSGASNGNEANSCEKAPKPTKDSLVNIRSILTLHGSALKRSGALSGECLGAIALLFQLFKK